MVENLETINKTMKFVFPSPMTMVKSHEKSLKLSLSLRYAEMLPNVDFEEMDTECVQQEKNMNFEDCVE